MMSNIICCFVGASLGTLFGILLASMLASNHDENDRHD